MEKITIKSLQFKQKVVYYLTKKNLNLWLIYITVQDHQKIGVANSYCDLKVIVSQSFLCPQKRVHI